VEGGARLDRASTIADPALANTALYEAYHGTTDMRASDVLPTGYVRVGWRGERGWSGRLGLGHSARLPDQQERFYALTRMGSDWVGNPHLAPSRNTGVEGDMRLTGRGIDAGVAMFVYRIDDDILATEQARRRATAGVTNVRARSYSNVDALMRGVELNATAPLASALFVSGDVSFVRGTTREPSIIGHNVPEMPPARAKLRVRYDNARWNAVAEIVASARQDDVADVLLEDPTPAFAVINVRAGLRWRSVDVSAGMDNVLDALYSEHLSYQRDAFRSGVRVHEPGRTLSARLSARF
jgi:iron complex outermembrane receptor protein